MKTSCLKYVLLVFSVGVLCTDAQALTLSRKTKAILKSGALGSAYTALALGAGYVTKKHYMNALSAREAGDHYRRTNRLNTNMAHAIADNSSLAALLTGLIATKSAYKAFNYFKHIKTLKNQDFGATEQVIV